MPQIEAKEVNLTLDGQLPFEATDEVSSALAAVGRTEDVLFSPDGRRLAIAGYYESKCLLIDIALDFAAGRKSILLSNVLEIASPEFHEPHGLAFLDAETMLVANRGGSLIVLKIPESGGNSRQVTLQAAPLGGDQALRSFLHTPGSVLPIPVGSGRYDVLVCNNFGHYVSRHRLETRPAMRITRNEVLLEPGLGLPDGIAVSPSRRWLAVSNHHAHTVLTYRTAWGLNRHCYSNGALRGTLYPHGVRFTSDGRNVLVADAGQPIVNIYSSTEWKGWSGDRYPSATIQVLSEADYLRGRINPEEGGPKGIDVDRGMNVLVATCHEMPLAFFDLSQAIRR